MNTFEYYKNLDSHPFTGECILDKSVKVRIKDEVHIRKFFDSTKDYEQITNLTKINLFKQRALKPTVLTVG